VLLPWIVLDCRQRSIDKVALFGAGTHTRVLLPLWRALGGPSVDEILVSERCDCPKTFDGVPVRAVSTVTALEVDAVILSSMSFESEMAKVCERWPDIPIYAPWMTSGRPDPVTTLERKVALLRRTVPFAIHRLRSSGCRRARLGGDRTTARLVEWIWRAWNGPRIDSTPWGPDSHAVSVWGPLADRGMPLALTS
jgi:hypothetical protein